MSYLNREHAKLSINNSLRDGEFDSSMIHSAVLRCNEIMVDISNFEVNIFEILGMRNLSSFVGEVFAASVAKESKGLFRKNPHQDGYPDLLLMDERGLVEYSTLSRNRREKSPFSPFRSGGVEIKATVGSTPSPVALAKKQLLKPDMGQPKEPRSTPVNGEKSPRLTLELLDAKLNGHNWIDRSCNPVVAAIRRYRFSIKRDSPYTPLPSAQSI